MSLNIKMPIPSMHKPLSLLISLLCCSSLSVVTQAQDNAQDNSLILEEIVVTAQKREESLQDVPISVATVTGEKLEDSGVENLEDLTALMPSIHFTETGISTQVRVRGIGSDNSQGFEQSVGMYVDGIYYGRAQLFRTPMLDMERAELLRGPQGTLFGKNSIAGALNLTTAKPTEELEGKFTVSHEFENNQNEFNGIISGPIKEDLLGRFAIRTYTEDGYMRNTLRDVDEGQTDELTVRGTLLWNATDSLAFSLKAEHNTFDTLGRNIEITQDEPLLGNTFTYSTALQSFGREAFEADRNFERQVDTPEFSNNSVDNLTLTTTYDMANDHTITAITGFLEYDYSERCDCDFSPATILDLSLEEDYEQFSQEIRITSPKGDKVEWLAGIFYQSFDQNFSDEIPIRPGNLLSELPTPQILVDLGFPTDLLAGIANTAVPREFTQTSETWAAFARATYHATDNLHFTLGARYTGERKTGTKVIDVTALDGSPLDPATAASAGLGFESPVFATQNEQASGHNLEAIGSNARKENEFTPFINVEYNVNNDLMVYASFTTGFKAGGFDPRSNNRDNFEFEEETADAFELGLKSTIADGRGEINAAIYRTDYENLQISQYDGAVGFNVGNAAETVVQGIELDGRWLFTEKLSASYGASLLDFEYKDYINGNCYAGQTERATDLNGDGNPDICDNSGRRGVYTPRTTVNVSLNYETPVKFGDNLSFIALLDVQHVASQNVHVNLDPDGVIDAYQMVNARIGIEHDDWKVSLLGKNLLDEYIRSYSGNASLSDTSFRTDTEYSFIRRPLTVALEAQYNF